jgi:hypothetical protein
MDDGIENEGDLIIAAEAVRRNHYLHATEAAESACLLRMTRPPGAARRSRSQHSSPCPLDAAERRGRGSALCDLTVLQGGCDAGPGHLATRPYFPTGSKPVACFGASMETGVVDLAQRP